MNYPYPVHRIQELLHAPKCLPAGTTVETNKTGRDKKGLEFETRPELIDGGFVDMRYLGKAPRLEEPETYDASFLLANQRVRGVGYCPIARENWKMKRRIPKGWHLNVCNPNLPTDDDRQNIHEPIPDFSPTDFRDFINRTAGIWKIDLGWEWEGELFS